MNYARELTYQRRHHERFKRFVETRKLACQECRGMGGYVEPVLDWGQGPWVPCGFCEGLGLTTPHLRGLWLSYRRAAQHQKEEGP